MKLAFIGIGVMGGPMAGHLAKAGHSVTVYNRSRAKVQGWAAQYQGTAADTPAEAAKGADIVFSCVGNDSDVREVTIGQQGAFQAMKRDAIFVDHTTASAAVALSTRMSISTRGVSARRASANMKAPAAPTPAPSVAVNTPP